MGNIASARAVATGIAAVLTFSLSVSSSASEPVARKKGSAHDVVFVGSSSANGALGGVMSHTLKSGGLKVWRRGYPSSGFARPDFQDMADVARKLPITEETRAVLVYLGGNDTQALWLRPEERVGSEDAWVKWSDDRWSAVYRKRAQEFFEATCQRGAKVTIVLLPVDVTNAHRQKMLGRIRTLQAEAASKSTCGVALSTSGDVGRFEVEGEPMRTPDGSHLTGPGARALWKRIKDDVMRRLPSPASPDAGAKASGGRPRGSSAG
jgi:hypothetical protein